VIDENLSGVPAGGTSDQLVGLAEVLAALGRATQLTNRSTEDTDPQEHVAIVDARALVHACASPLTRVAQTVKIMLDGGSGKAAAMSSGAAAPALTWLAAEKVQLDLIRPYLSLLQDSLQELTESAGPYLQP
jgi:hypothetical protein